MQIAYLIPEFPGQTHSFFWRERAALHEIGITAHIVSTREPSKALMSHQWAKKAKLETFYLARLGAADVARVCFDCLHFSPAAWMRVGEVAVRENTIREWPSTIASILLAVRLATFMKSRNLTHVHVHSCANSALIALFANRLADITYSLTLHGDLRDYGRQQRIKWRYAAFAITITHRLYDQVHLELGEDLPKAIGIAPMGVDPAVFRRARSYTPWNGSGSLRLFSCGRLNYVKGHQDLIRAVAILTKAGVNVCLEIAGEDELGGGGFHRQLDDTISHLNLVGNVKLLGAVNEQQIIEGLETAHLFVLASHHEPLGVAIMEAMSCKTPVISTNGGGVPELIDHGVDGFLVSPQNPEDLASSIKELALNASLAKQFSAAGRSKVLRRFNSNASAAELKRMLELTSASREIRSSE
jgi:glycosyltransferase involved in cell wall biosynthesis